MSAPTTHGPARQKLYLPAEEQLDFIELPLQNIRLLQHFGESTRFHVLPLPRLQAGHITKQEVSLDNQQREMQLRKAFLSSPLPAYSQTLHMKLENMRLILPAVKQTLPPIMCFPACEAGLGYL